MDVNLWAVLAAAVANMILGSIWYAPPVFGNYWMRLTGRGMGDGSSPMKAMTWMFVATLVTSYVLAHFVLIAGASTAADLFALAFWLWLGFTGMITLQTVFFENRPFPLWALNNAYNFLAIALMAMVIGLWPF